jgi:uncharacterized protein (DUF2252 family)
MHFDAIALAQKQIERDRAATKRQKGLFEHKMERMTLSPLAFLRGAAPLYYDLLGMFPELAKGPDGTGWITGDLHLENFGAFKPDSRFEDGEEAVFDLNDFDDCTIAPLRFDVLRLTTSLILGGREMGCDGMRSLALCRDLLASYAKHLATKAKLPPMPHVVHALVKQAQGRPRKALLDARTTVHKGERRFVRGPRYQDLKPDVRKAVPEAFETYTNSLEDRPKKDHLEIIDAAFRVAGTGSLGCVRIAILVVGKGGADGQWVFDMKEEGTPSSSDVVKMPKMNGAERVLAGLRACLDSPPKMAGTTRLLGLPMLVRRLTPQEDKLDLANIKDEELPALAAYLGALVGKAHRKGAVKRPTGAWTADELDSILEHAIRLAGVHEATYLALCKMVG